MSALLGLGLKLFVAVSVVVIGHNFVVENVGGFTELLDLLKDTVVSIYYFFQSIIGLFSSFVSIIPSPYANVISTFLVINFGIILWKLVRA